MLEWDLATQPQTTSSYRPFRAFPSRPGWGEPAYVANYGGIRAYALHGN